MNPRSQQSTDTSTNSSGTTNPWAVQTPYLTQAFQDASGALNTANNTAQIPTNFTATYSPDQISAFQQMLGYGTSNGAIPASSANAGDVLSTQGANGVTAGVNGLTGFTPQGGTQSNINAAMQYAGNVPVDALTKAAMQPANDEASYFTNPQIDATAAGSGNINSSRDAIAHGLVAKGLTQDAANTAAGIEGSAYTNGLNLAEQNSEATNANKLQSLNELLSGGSSAGVAGTLANTGSVNQAGGLFDIANNGITGGYNAAQAPLTNQAQQFTANTNDPFAALDNFYNIVGNHNWGSSTTNTGSGTQTTNSTPSTLSQIGGWTNFLGSLF